MAATWLTKSVPNQILKTEPLERKDGIWTYRLPNWLDFFRFLEAELFPDSEHLRDAYIWRGQKNPSWTLSSTLDRLFSRTGQLELDPDAREMKALELLESFRYAARGRRGRNPTILPNLELWALGQHFGLATPLLDWTRSPFAAAYFAFEESGADSDGYRVVFALNQFVVGLKNIEIAEGPSKETGRTPIIEFVEPMSDENDRLISQGGLFSRAPIGVAIDEWVNQVFAGSDVGALIRIELPSAERLPCLRALNRMNINHLSLFPDLTGAARSTNLRWELKS